jgi:hypothetical protein
MAQLKEELMEQAQGAGLAPAKTTAVNPVAA